MKDFADDGLKKLLRKGDIVEDKESQLGRIKWKVMKQTENQLKTLGLL